MLRVKGNQGFSTLEGINRPIVPSHVTKMATSIESMGIIRPVVVAAVPFLKHGNTSLHIVDGQHLYHACIRLGIDIPYTEVTVNDTVHLIETLAMLNNSSKSWVLLDYITAWENVNPHFSQLRHYFNVYDLELLQIAELFHNGIISLNHTFNASRVIKNGTFEVRNEKENVLILDQITDVLKTVPRMNRSCNKALVAAYVSFYKQYQSRYNHALFLAYLHSQKAKLSTSTQDPEEFQKLFVKGI